MRVEFDVVYSIKVPLHIPFAPSGRGGVSGTKMPAPDQKMKSSMAGIFLLFILALGFGLYESVRETNKWIDFTEKEMVGVEYNRLLRRLLEDLMHHRGMTNAYMSGDPSFKSDVEMEHSRVEKAIRAVDTLNDRYGQRLKVDERWKAFRISWMELDFTEHKSPKEFFDSHTALIANVISLMAYIGETSNLILDPEVASYYLMDCTTFKRPAFLEKIGQARGVGVGAAVAGRLGPDEKRQLIVLSGTIKSFYDETGELFQRVFKNKPELEPRMEGAIKEFDGDIKAFLDVLDRGVINAPKVIIRPADYYTIATKAIDSGFRLYDQESLALGELLHDRISGYKAKRSIFAFVASILSIVFIYVFLALRKNIAKLEFTQKDLKRLSVTDSLTQIYNRLKFDDTLELEIHRSRRFKHPFSIIMFDIDHFKDINDSMGHQAGDVILKELARAVSMHIRAADTFARWGGEEFTILVVETAVEGATIFAEKLRKEIEAFNFSKVGRLACSFGVAEFGDGDDFDNLMKRVDEALYEAKKGGRNRVCVK